jgi:hypothetical protein
MPALPSSSILSPRRHPSRLFDPPGSLRSALTGPGGDAREPFPERREGQALFWQSLRLGLGQARGPQCR